MKLKCRPKWMWYVFIQNQLKLNWIFGQLCAFNSICAMCGFWNRFQHCIFILCRERERVTDWYGRALKSNQTKCSDYISILPKNIWLWHFIYSIQFDSIRHVFFYVYFHNPIKKKTNSNQMHNCVYVSHFYSQAPVLNGYLLKSINYFAWENNYNFIVKFFFFIYSRCLSTEFEWIVNGRNKKKNWHRKL